LYPVADNYADSKYPVLGHYGKNSVLYVGNSYDHAQNIWGSERIYIRFDLTGLPKNLRIIQATLWLWQFYAPKFNQTYEAHRVLGEWNETAQNWNNQPPWASEGTFEATAPNENEVGVQWDITRDVKAWYNGEAPNFGTMIKVAKEENAADASSGFWSREYPVDGHEEWKPKLIITFLGEETSGYSVTVMIAGLGNGTASVVTIDGKEHGPLFSGQEEKFTFDRGTNHTIAVSKLLSQAADARYRCDENQIWVSAETSHVFYYATEYSVTFQMEPSGMFETPATGWYTSNQTLPVRRTGPDVSNPSPGVRLIFDGWYLNSEKMKTEPTAILVIGPTTVEGRYRTEYLLNVTSPIGKTQGSGWYAAGTAAVFSVDVRSVPAEGILGILGLRRSLLRWSGSDNFLGVPVQPEGSVLMKEPTAIGAVWEYDYSSLIANLGALLLVAVAACVIAILMRRRSRGRDMWFGRRMVGQVRKKEFNKIQEDSSEVAFPSAAAPGQCLVRSLLDRVVSVSAPGWCQPVCRPTMTGVKVDEELDDCVLDGESLCEVPE